MPQAGVYCDASATERSCRAEVWAYGVSSEAKTAPPLTLQSGKTLAATSLFPPSSLVGPLWPLLSEGLVTRMFDWEAAPSLGTFTPSWEPQLGIPPPPHQLSLGFPLPPHQVLRLLSLCHWACPSPWTQVPCSGNQLPFLLGDQETLASLPSTSQGPVF